MQLILILPLLLLCNLPSVCEIHTVASNSQSRERTRDVCSFVALRKSAILLQCCNRPRLRIYASSGHLQLIQEQVPRVHYTIPLPNPYSVKKKPMNSNILILFPAQVLSLFLHIGHDLLGKCHRVCVHIHGRT